MKLLLKFLCVALLFISCSNEDDVIPTPIVEPVVYSFDSDLNSGLMYQDDEPLDSLYSIWRQYELKHIIRVKAVDSTRIEVANFAPMDLEDVTILVKIDTIDSPVKLFHIKKIRAHAVQVIEYPFVAGTKMFLTQDGGEVDLSPLKEGVDPSELTFDFTGETELVQKLLKLKKLSWSIRFHDFNSANNPETNWGLDLTGRDIRRFTGLLINYGILFTSEDFRQEFLAEHIIGNDGVTVFNTEEKQAIIDNLLNETYYRCGIVVKVGGLGGKTTLGLAEYVLNGFLTPGKQVSPDIISHELMHSLGYNHTSNLTYPKKVDDVSTGMNPVARRVVSRFFENGDIFPVTNENYYKPTDFVTN